MAPFSDKDSIHMGSVITAHKNERATCELNHSVSSAR